MNYRYIMEEMIQSFISDTYMVEPSRLLSGESKDTFPKTGKRYFVEICAKNYGYSIKLVLLDWWRCYRALLILRLDSGRHFIY